MKPRGGALDQETQGLISRLFMAFKAQLSPKSPLLAKAALLFESILKEGGISYFDFKKRLFTLEEGQEQVVLEIIQKYESAEGGVGKMGNLVSQAGGGVGAGDGYDFLLQSKNTVGLRL